MKKNARSNISLERNDSPLNEIIFNSMKDKVSKNLENLWACKKRRSTYTHIDPYKKEREVFLHTPSTVLSLIFFHFAIDHWIPPASFPGNSLLFVLLIGVAIILPWKAGRIHSPLLLYLENSKKFFTQTIVPSNWIFASLKIDGYQQKAMEKLYTLTTPKFHLFCDFKLENEEYIS